MASLKVNSPNTKYTNDYIESKYVYEVTKVHSENGQVIAVPQSTDYTFRVQRKVRICRSNCICSLIHDFLYDSATGVFIHSPRVTSRLAKAILAERNLQTLDILSHFFTASVDFACDL